MKEINRMDVRVNTDLLLQLRRERAWSQQYLAEVSGLSIKTIQRIEKRQTGSYESIKAIASAFDVLPHTLQVTAVSQNQAVSVQKRLMAMASQAKQLALGLIVGVGVTFMWMQMKDYGPNSLPQIAEQINDFGQNNFQIQAQRVSTTEDQMTLFEGEVTLIVNNQASLEIQSNEMLKMPDKNVFRGGVSILVDGKRFTSDVIETINETDNVVIYSQALSLASL